VSCGHITLTEVLAFGRTKATMAVVSVSASQAERTLILMFLSASKRNNFCFRVRFGRLEQQVLHPFMDTFTSERVKPKFSALK
jgi:hypothetical protein